MSYETKSILQIKSINQNHIFNQILIITKLIDFMNKI